MKPPLYILAGGTSRRFGSDKARAEYRGEPLVVHVANALAAATTAPVIVADRPGRYEDLGTPTIGDRTPGRGPLGGLDRAFTDLAERHPGKQWLLLVSCDFVDPDPAWVASLVSHRDGVVAVAFRGSSGWEPLFTLYHAAVHDEVRTRLSDEKRSLQGLLDGIAAASLPTPSTFRHVSTPAELRESALRPR
ncbi:MAG: molybdenum cofactor guanylyltransferase [Acidimicrobiia bacterium]